VDSPAAAVASRSRWRTGRDFGERRQAEVVPAARLEQGMRLASAVRPPCGPPSCCRQHGDQAVVPPRAGLRQGSRGRAGGNPRNPRSRAGTVARRGPSAFRPRPIYKVQPAPLVAGEGLAPMAQVTRAWGSRARRPRRAAPRGPSPAGSAAGRPCSPGLASASDRRLGAAAGAALQPESWRRGPDVRARRTSAAAKAGRPGAPSPLARSPAGGRRPPLPAFWPASASARRLDPARRSARQLEAAVLGMAMGPSPPSELAPP
jgi:hypothetical protein